MLRARSLSAVAVACLVSIGVAGVALAAGSDFWTGVVRHHPKVIVQVAHPRGHARATVAVSWECRTGPYTGDSYRFVLKARIRQGRLKASGAQPVNSGSGHLAVSLRGLRAGHRATGDVSWAATDINGHRCSGHGTWSGAYVR